MFQRAPHILTILTLALSLFVFGCGDDDATTPGATSTADFGGKWAVDLEVVARRVCDRPVGTLVDNVSLYVAQRGTTARLFFEFEGIELVVAGSRATGGGSFGPDRSVQFDLRIENGELSGTVAFADSSVPCTEVVEVSGTRQNEPPNLDFEGDWDFALTLTESDCPGEDIGRVERLCRSIEVDGNSVAILGGEEGVVLGLGDGETTELRWNSDQYELGYYLSGTGDVLTGTYYVRDIRSDCAVSGTVVATRRTAPCGEDGTPADFSGTWAWTAEEIDNGNSCGLPVGPDCSEFVQQGNLVTIESDGVFGTVSGNTLSASVSEILTGTVTLTVSWQLELSADGSSFTGTNTVGFSDPQNPDDDCETVVSVSGARTISCDQQ